MVSQWNGSSRTYSFPAWLLPFYLGGLSARSKHLCTVKQLVCFRVQVLQVEEDDKTRSVDLRALGDNHE